MRVIMMIVACATLLLMGCESKGPANPRMENEQTGPHKGHCPRTDLRFGERCSPLPPSDWDRL